ncbi:hypothetical protein J437_LFUL007177 [Ladona fulva]|uniref:Uncharacterized protein n=1 Tax=Ladona fulva TaxID=123851 RepID=A0A8K0K7E5_LADFU|nr:hypothetical protein J437_LFUL007177 [Ladona fulva]
MASPRKCPVSICEKWGIKPITKNNILYFYIPLQSASSYAGLSVNVVNPNFVSRLIPNRDITSLLLVNSVVGAGLHIYNRPHLLRASPKERVLFSAYGAVVFSFGSVLLWAVIRSLIPDRASLCTVLGLSSSVALLGIGKKYLDYIDTSCGY